MKRLSEKKINFFSAALLACAALLSCRTAPPVEPPAPAAAVPAPPPPPAWVRTPPPPALASHAAAAPAVSQRTLENGLRIVVVEHHRRPVVTVNFVFPHGALSDPADNAGLTFMSVHLASDFYESMGVNDNPGDERSFRRRVLELGGTANFDVEPDNSLVQIAGYAQDTAGYIVMLKDAVRKLRHGSRSFLARRAAALDAFEEIESEDPQALQQLLAEAAFGQDHPYARSLSGTTESLTGMELEEVMDHQHLVFSPAGATLLVVGDVKPEAVFAAVQPIFENWEGGNAPVPAVPPPALPRNAGEIGFLDRHGASTLFTCAMRPLPEVAGNNATLRVLVSILGQGLHSRLNTVLREDNGLTYGAGAEIVRRRQASALIACSALQASRADLGVRLFRSALEGVRESAPTDDEVRRAKAVLLAELESSWDDVGTVTRAWLTAITMGEGAPRLDRERAEIERVTSHDLQKLARTLFKLKTFRWVVSGERKTAAQAFEASGFGKLHPFKPGS
jgi:predicted Zn-dependent peptidase